MCKSMWLKRCSYGLSLAPRVLCPAPGHFQIIRDKDVVEHHICSEGQQLKAHSRDGAQGEGLV